MRRGFAVNEPVRYRLDPSELEIALYSSHDNSISTSPSDQFTLPCVCGSPLPKSITRSRHYLGIKRWKTKEKKTKKSPEVSQESNLVRGTPMEFGAILTVFQPLIAPHY